MSKLTPQQKKALSYAHDRRNGYGENDKSSRKAIALRKAAARRAFRHVANQALHEAEFAATADDADAVESRVASVREEPFKKSPDVPLQEHIAKALESRAARSGRKSAEARLRRRARRGAAL